MRRSSLFSLTLLAVITAGTFVDSADAAIFGRRWERRKAEIKSEVSGQLSAKIDADIATQTAAATEKINAATQDKVTAESLKLSEQVKQEVAKLREDAQALVAAEAKKLQDQATAQTQQIEVAAKQLVSAEMDKLKQAAEAQAAQLKEAHEAHEARLKEAIAKLDAKIVEETKKLELAYTAQAKAFHETNLQQFNALSSGVKADASKFATAEAERIKAELLNELRATVQTELKSANTLVATPAAPQPAPVEEKKPQETAAPTPNVQPVNEKEQDDAGE